MSSPGLCSLVQAASEFVSPTINFELIRAAVWPAPKSQIWVASELTIRPEYRILILGSEQLTQNSAKLLQMRH
jgi:hypothetical protein